MLWLSDSIGADGRSSSVAYAVYCAGLEFLFWNCPSSARTSILPDASFQIICIRPTPAIKLKFISLATVAGSCHRGRVLWGKLREMAMAGGKMLGKSWRCYGSTWRQFPQQTRNYEADDVWQSIRWWGRWCHLLADALLRLMKSIKLFIFAILFAGSFAYLLKCCPAE